MAYMNQKLKSKLTPGIKKVLAKYGMKGSISTSRHSLSVNIKSGKLDMIGDYINYNSCEDADGDYFRMAARRDTGMLKKTTSIQVNEYHISSFHSGKCREFLLELKDAMNIGNHDNSDIQTDYFDVGWYTYINVGKWNKPYTLEV